MTTPVASIKQATDLLVLLSRSDFSESEKDKAEELCRMISDWGLFSRLATRHGIVALVYQNLNDLGLTRLIPENDRQAMENIWLQAITRVTYITSVATEIVSELEKHNIRAVLLKGLALEHTVYGSRGLRQMSDADLLVSHDDVLNARDIIHNMGFISQPLKSSLYRRILLDIGNHLPEMHKGGISVDLHHRLFGPLAARLTEKAIDTPVEIQAGGIKCFILPPQIAFLYMVSHIRKHEVKGEFQLRLYNDVYLILKSYLSEIVTPELMKNAVEAGVEDLTRRVLLIIRKVYGIEIPDDLVIKDDEDNIIREFRALLENPGMMSSLNKAERYKNTLRSLPGMKSRLIYISGDIFPSFQFMKVRYQCRTKAGCLLRYPHRLGKIFWALAALFRS